MFKSDQFLTAWTEWKEHYTEKAKMSYTSVSERKALAALFKKCDGREQLAIDSINYSMEKNWAAIYIISNNGNGQGNSNNSGQNNRQSGTSTDRVERASKW